MPKMSRAMHSLSHYRLATLDMGYLVPVGCVEVLPGDMFNHSSRLLLRVQPLLKPVMHPVQVRIHHWFVPNRILWSSWDDFITRSDPDLTVPTISFTSGVSDYSLIDHLGIVNDDLDFNALPVRAYNAIYNFAYRDQDLISEVSEDDLALKRVAWEKDRFTSARANPQQGASIPIPFDASSQVPITGIGVDTSFTTPITSALDVQESTGETTQYASAAGTWQTSAVQIELDGSENPQIFADLSNATSGIDINDFRQAMAQQKFLEHRNRFGSRFEDYLRFLGIRPSDSRLQNPEYLGGGRNTISFSEILSTADSGSLTVGDLAGHGIGVLNTRRYRRFFQEHGVVLSLLSIRPRTMYSQSLPKMFLRSTAWDYWQKELEMMGPQEVYTKEVYQPHANATDVFGYNGRHDDYRHIQSYVSGQFRDGGSEEDWHYGRDFTTSPALNQSFVDCIPTERVYADTVTPEIYAMVSHNLKARRLVSGRAKH